MFPLPAHRSMVQAAKRYGHIVYGSRTVFDPHNRGTIQRQMWSSCTDFGDWVIETLERDREIAEREMVRLVFGVEKWTDLETEALRHEALDRLSSITTVQEMLDDSPSSNNG